MTTLNSSNNNIDNYDIVPKGDIIIISYKGVFKSVTSEYLLNWIERFYSNRAFHPRIKLKCVFRVSVELIQNLIHHSSSYDSVFFISKSAANSYVAPTVNLYFTFSSVFFFFTSNAF